MRENFPIKYEYFREKLIEKVQQQIKQDEEREKREKARKNRKYKRI